MKQIINYELKDIMNSIKKLFKMILFTNNSLSFILHDI